LDSRQAIDARLAQPFGDVFQGKAQGEKATIENCNDYLRLSTQSFQAEDNRAAGILHNDAVECVALAMLRSARVPGAALLPGFQMNAETLNRLPPELAPAVSNELIAREKAADAARGSWKTYAPNSKAVVQGPGRLSVSQTGWRTQLTLYARGDFSGKGNEELLLRADYHAQQGTYGNSKLFLLARGNPGTQRLRLVREVPVP
jgi:hypothetical protein